MVTFKIIHWNIRSITSNSDNLKILIKEEDPDIITLNETWLKEEQFLKILGYNITRQDRADGKGGIATLLKDSIPFSIGKINRNLFNERTQLMVVKTEKMNIINIYNPPDVRINENAILRELQKIEHPYIILGDWNSHHLMWGSSKNNFNGEN